jgi:acyl carrier protein phosphodiesterase
VNFLAHLWLADRARLPLAGAILGDVLRGPLPPDLPAPLAQSVRLHRRIDAATDRHPRVREARHRFAPPARRHAGIVIDVLFDHVLAREWGAYSTEPLAEFARRAALAVAAEPQWFDRGGAPVPAPLRFAALLASYRREAGIERALRRTAARLRQPSRLLEAMAGWRAHVPALRRDLPAVLADLGTLGPEGGSTKV